jgi:hypothetical protein
MVEKGHTDQAECPQCGQTFKKLGLHWARGSCDYPKPDSEATEILTGLFMGDGSLAAHDSENPYMRWNNINREFLQHIDTTLGWLTTGVRLKKSAETVAKQTIERDRNGWNLNSENFNAIYGTRTRRLPYFRKFNRWYNDTQKRYPESLELTPTIAKYWYAGDGTVNWMREYSARVVFACQNESDRPDFIRKLFTEAGFEVRQNRHMYYLSVDESKRFLQWMGDPVPGYEYKWEIESRPEYEQLK